MNRKQRTTKDAQEALESAARIAGRFDTATSTPTHLDIHALRTAANQARQATMNLDILLGMLESEIS